jgi:uncharacterized protein YktA (UPF0223 family)
MNYKTFKSILKAMKKQHRVDRQINKVLQLAQSDTYFMGTTIDEIGQAFDMVFLDEYGEIGLDLIQWWLYEDVDKLISDVKTDEVIADLTKMKDLWEYTENRTWDVDLDPCSPDKRAEWWASKRVAKFAWCDEVDAPQMLMILDTEWWSEVETEVMNWLVEVGCNYEQTIMGMNMLYIPDATIRTMFVLKWS